METDPRLLPANRMARRLGVRIAWLKAEAAAGRLPAAAAGNTFLFDPDVVEHLLWKRAQLDPAPAPAGEAVRVALNDTPIATPEVPAVLQEPPGLVLTDAECARLLHVSRSHWRGLVASGRAPNPIKLGRSTRWGREELAAWIAAGAPPRHRWTWRGAQDVR